MWLRVVGINDIIGISLDMKIFFVIWLFFKGWSSFCISINIGGLFFFKEVKIM